MLLLMKALGAEVLVFLLTCAVLFLPAGTLIWPAAWVFLGFFFGFVAILAFWLSRHDPGLLNERVTILKPDQQPWDKFWLILFYTLSLAWFALMALDAVRWRWSPMPIWLTGGGIVLLLSAFVLIFLTLKENSYLSPTVRIQSDRGHTVITSGPYRLIRHPLYSGAFLFYLGVPLLFRSWWGLALSVVVLIEMLVLRAILEEQILQQKLPGYAAYMEQVRSRFVPHVW